ncbi:hypothetical protein HOY80DRAFT_961026 [Tuber brumale]|nr:hypothetical protein HOY80DRAFT_961026 [Tuber brumale]
MKVRDGKWGHLTICRRSGVDGLNLFYYPLLVRPVQVCRLAWWMLFIAGIQVLVLAPGLPVLYSILMECGMVYQLILNFTLCLFLSSLFFFFF